MEKKVGVFVRVCFGVGIVLVGAMLMLMIDLRWCSV
jgi:hypothetical protein